MNTLKEQIIDAVNDAKDLETGQVQNTVLENFLDGIIDEHLDHSNEDKKITQQEMQAFIDQTKEDYILWDPEEQGIYPTERIIIALDNFIKSFK